MANLAGKYWKTMFHNLTQIFYFCQSAKWNAYKENCIPNRNYKIDYEIKISITGTYM